MSMLSKSIRFLLTSAALAASTPAFAAPAASGDPLDELFITATRTPQALDDVTVSHEVVTREELARAAGAEVSDLLRYRTGLEFSRNGGPGQNTSLFIRGTDSNHALVLVDGVRFNPGTIGGAALQNLPTSLIERIEVVKGPLSTLYGSDALGGVVQVFTRRPTQSGLEVTAGGGRWGTQQASVQGALAGETLSLSVGGSWLQSDGFATRSEDNTPRGYDNRSFTAALRGEVGKAELTLQAWRASGTAEYSDFFLTPVDQDYTNQVVALSARMPVNERWDTTLRLAYMEDDLQQNQKPDFLVNFDGAQTERTTLDWQNNVALGGHTLTAGVLLQRESTVASSFDTTLDADTDLNSAYLQDRFSLDAAGRHGLLLAAGYTDHSTFGGQATWNAEYTLRVTDGLRLSAAAGTAFRAPDSTDRFGFGGNPDLDPERARSVELAAAWTPAPGHQLRVAAFQNQVQDLIQYVVTDFETFDGANQNVERARIRGVEASYAWRGQDWALRLEGTHQDPRDLSNATQLLRRARNTATLGVERRLGGEGRHVVALDLLASGKRQDFGGETLDSYVVATLSTNVQLTPQWTVQARLENLTDEKYELARGYNTLRRALFFTTRYTFK